jgi:sulfur-oxidizing protein SoxZ
MSGAAAPVLTAQPRVEVPKSATKGAVFPVKVLITHAMETGLRRDDRGRIIPRKIINAFACRYAGTVVFRVEFHESMAANPYLEFYLEATTSGLLEFLWEEDGGATARLQQSLTVA